MSIRNATPSVGQQGIMSNIPQWAISNATIPSVTGRINLGYFRANRSGTFSSIHTMSGTTVAAATPTTCLMGLYSVADSGDLTRVGVIGNDTALWAAANTGYTRAFASPVAVRAGAFYAFAEIVVSAVATPTFGGPSPLAFSNAQAALGDRTAGFLTGQTDLPSSISAGSISATAFAPFFALVP